MLHLPSPALRPLVTNTTLVIRRDAAEELCVIVGDVGVATDTGGVLVGTNVPTHVITLSIGTFHVVVTDDLTPGVGGVGGAVLETLVVTCH